MDLQEVRCGVMDQIDLAQGAGQVAGTCECGDELLGSIKCAEFLYQLKTGQLLEKDSAPWRKYLSMDDRPSISKQPEEAALCLPSRSICKVNIQ